MSKLNIGMDPTTSNIFGVIGFAFTVAGGIYTAVNHKRIRSKCCGVSSEASLDIENTTPSKPADEEPRPKNAIVAA